MRLTRRTYLEMKLDCLTDDFIKQKYDIDQNQLYDLKKRWNLVNKLPKVNEVKRDIRDIAL